MTQPVEVVIVQHGKSLSRLFRMLAGSLVSFFVTTWVLMLLLGGFFPAQGLSYFQSAGLYVVANILFKTGGHAPWELYTRDPRLDK